MLYHRLIKANHKMLELKDPVEIIKCKSSLICWCRQHSIVCDRHWHQTSQVRVPFLPFAAWVTLSNYSAYFSIYRMQLLMDLHARLIVRCLDETVEENQNHSAWQVVMLLQKSYWWWWWCAFSKCQGWIIITIIKTIEGVLAYDSYRL